MIWKSGKRQFVGKVGLVKLGLILAAVLILVLLQKDALLLLAGVEPVGIKPAGNFFDAPVELELSTPLTGSIRYTLDGSEPVPESPIYTNPIAINESVVIRYAVFRDDRRVSQVLSHDVFVGVHHSVPVISLTTEPENLWDPETGIYTEGNNKNHLQEGEDWERPAEVRFYETDGSLAFQELTGIRLHGNAMRVKPQKGFRIYIKDINGRNGRLRYPLFGENGNREYASFILRNGGDPKTLLRDRLAGALAEEQPNIIAQKSRPAVLYLNGQYWGLYYIYERFDDVYFSERYRFKPSSLSMIEIPLRDGDDRGKAIADTRNSARDAEQFNDLLREVRSCGSCGSFTIMSQYFDMENFIDYYIFEMFFANVDWPYNNAKLWRYGTDEYSPEPDAIKELDGRFRWLLFDLDAGLGGAYKTEEDMLRAADSNTYTKLVDDAYPFRNMFNNRLFRERYRQRLEELLGTTLSPENMEAKIDALAAEIRPELPRQIERWSAETLAAGGEAVADMEEWERNVELLKLYVRHRPEGFAARTEDYFAL